MLAVIMVSHRYADTMNEEGETHMHQMNNELEAMRRHPEGEKRIKNKAHHMGRCGGFLMVGGAKDQSST